MFLSDQQCMLKQDHQIWVNNAGIQSETRNRPFSNKVLLVDTLLCFDTNLVELQAMLPTVRENAHKILAINLQAVRKVVDLHEADDCSKVIEGSKLAVCMLELLALEI
eukprot:472492-Hanusia_phi.AAC.13